VRWIPALRDLHRVIQCIAACEDLRYPFPAKGRSHLVDFLRDAVRCTDWESLARKYRIPERDGDRVVNSNGADLSRRQRTSPNDDNNIDAEIARLDARRFAGSRDE
jgi:hypothetical protein